MPKTMCIPPCQLVAVKMTTATMIKRFLEMFKARKYPDPTVKTLDDGTVHVETELDGEKYALVYTPSSKFNVRLAEDYVTMFKNNGVAHAIVVYRESITGFAKRVLLTCVGVDIEIFAAKVLAVNITTHVFQPKHFKVIDAKTRSTFDAKKWTLNIPRMLVTDPIARYFNFKKGNIIEIHRNDDTIAYRRVV